MDSTFHTPTPGDIVWCRFPIVESIQPGPKPRPALVLSVMDHESPVRVRVAYGTSQKLTPVRKGDLVVDAKNPVAYLASGLSYPTKFALSKVLVLPYTSLWFERAPLAGGLLAPCPKLGVLHATLMIALQRAAKEAGLIQ